MNPHSPDFRLQEITLGTLLDCTAKLFPASDALVQADTGFRRTWQEFAADVDELARGLMALGVRQHDKIAVWAVNIPQWVTLMFATARIGAVLVTVNTSYREMELSYLLQHADCDTLCIIGGMRDKSFIEAVYALVPELREQPRGALHSAVFPALKRVIVLENSSHTGMYNLPEVLALAPRITQAEAAALAAKISPYDIVTMQYTSGTTGQPKGVMLSHVNIVNNGYWIGANEGFCHMDRICLPVPLHHCLGCVIGVMACVCHGAAMVLVDTFIPASVLRVVEQERCTALYGVPSMYQALLRCHEKHGFALSSLRTGIMTGAVCPEALVRRVMNQMHLHGLSLCYGMTEASPIMAQTRGSDTIKQRTSTVGRALPGIEISIRDPHTGHALPCGTEGEICCRGYNVMLGYYKMPEATAQAIDAEGWLHSGDLGMLDEAGYLCISGRIKDMIIRCGENISPREVEEFLLCQPDIFDAQVVGVPSEVYGEEVGAFLIPREGASLSPDDIRCRCLGRIANYKIPRYVAIVDAFPMTASGKVRKHALRDIAARLFLRSGRRASRVT
ncbi:MAG: AMP-binding protein [Desulfovibrionaceae bacterium]|nr:AMP-binding protein [Desulfovibrionaceae bacterium]